MISQDVSKDPFSLIHFDSKINIPIKLTAKTLDKVKINHFEKS